MKNFTLKQHWIFGNILMGIGLAISTLDIFANPTQFRIFPLVLAVIFVAVGYIYHRKFFKCPFCDSVLPSSLKFPDRCEQCGKSLSEHVG